MPNTVNSSNRPLPIAVPMVGQTSAPVERTRASDIVPAPPRSEPTGVTSPATLYGAGTEVVAAKHIAPARRGVYGTLSSLCSRHRTLAPAILIDARAATAAGGSAATVADSKSSATTRWHSTQATFIEQKFKAKNGAGAVMRIDDTSIQGGGQERNSRLAERYASAEAYQRSTRGSAFIEGLRNYHETNIPGVDDKTSALEMKRLFLEGQLTPTQRGALSGRITEVSQAECIDKVLRLTAVFSEDFRRAGSTFDRLVPQDFYLVLVGDKSGRCYPLVRAMAVAVASRGEDGVNRLVEKLFLAAADPQAGSSTVLKISLAKLHSNIDAVQASTERGQVKLRDVVSRLAASTQTSMFALNTRQHSMMVGSTVGAEGRRYYFYDPNVGIFAFEDKNSLSKAMTQHLVERKLAAHYGSFGRAWAPIFDLVEIDTDMMAAVPLHGCLSVADLSRPGEWVNAIENTTPG